MPPDYDASDAGRSTVVLSSVLLQLPEQLRFTTVARWLAPGEQPGSLPDFPAWRFGDPGGFTIFGPAPPLVPVIARPSVIRHGWPPKLVGDRLFASQIGDVLARRFGQLASQAALHEAGVFGPDGDRIADAVKAAARIDGLNVPLENPPCLRHRSDTGRLRLSMTLSYTGNQDLWNANASDERAQPWLRAEVAEDRLVLAAWVDPGGEARAEALIRRALLAVQRQLAAQQAFLSGYAAALDGNAKEYAALWLRHHAAGQTTRCILVRAETSFTEQT